MTLLRTIDRRAEPVKSWWLDVMLNVMCKQVLWAKGELLLSHFKAHIEITNHEHASDPQSLAFAQRGAYIHDCSHVMWRTTNVTLVNFDHGLVTSTCFGSRSLHRRTKKAALDPAFPSAVHHTHLLLPRQLRAKHVLAGSWPIPAETSTKQLSDALSAPQASVR